MVIITKGQIHTALTELHHECKNLPACPGYVPMSAHTFPILSTPHNSKPYQNDCMHKNYVRIPKPVHTMLTAMLAQALECHLQAPHLTPLTPATTQHQAPCKAPWPTTLQAAHTQQTLEPSSTATPGSPTRNGSTRQALATFGMNAAAGLRAAGWVVWAMPGQTKIKLSHHHRHMAGTPTYMHTHTPTHTHTDI